jgi:A/G-specific adenine glycosylase
MRANAAARLAQHYVDNSRALPWRAPPGSNTPPDPYRVWLSEVMLQQTTVAAVIPRFERFTARWPNVFALADADETVVLAEWAGLGYYARARNLIACARAVAAAGGFPSSSEDLRKLPGIGRYTAAAIAAIAFGERTAAVDTNIRRVLSRVYGLSDPTPADLEHRFLDWLGDRPGDMVQAMMDLGATICTSRRPSCPHCPLAKDCVALSKGDPEGFPVRQAKRARPQRFGIAWWIERDGHVWLVRRPDKGVLGGMSALPGEPWAEAPHRLNQCLAEVRHVFTHFTLDLTVVAHEDIGGEGWWQPLDAIASAGLPTLYRKAVDAVLGLRGGDARGTARERLEEALGEP